MADEERPQNVCRTLGDGPSLGSDVVTVVVGHGHDVETFIIHENLLREHSTFFDEALNRRSEERAKRVVLPMYRPEIFKVYFKFLYTGLVFIKEEGANAELIFTPPNASSFSGFTPFFITDVVGSIEFFRWSVTYKMADCLRDPDFNDALVDALIEMVADVEAGRLGQRFSFAPDFIDFIYTYSEDFSPTRRLIVDTNMHAWNLSDYQAAMMHIERPKFLCDMLAAAAPYLTGAKDIGEMENPIHSRDTCKYHEHVLYGKPCYRTKYGYH